MQVMQLHQRKDSCLHLKACPSSPNHKSVKIPKKGTDTRINFPRYMNAIKESSQVGVRELQHP